MSTMLRVLGVTLVVARAAGDAAFDAKCAGAYAKCLHRALGEVSTVRRTIDEGTVVDALGSRAADISNDALEAFSKLVPDASGDKEKEKVFDARVEELGAALEAPLKGAYLRQLTLLRSKTLKKFKRDVAGAKDRTKAERDAYREALAGFKDMAERSILPGTSWTYDADYAAVQSSISELYKRTKREEDLKKAAAAQMQSASAFLRFQQQQLQSYQSQMSPGGPAGWNSNIAYHIPDTGLNLLLKYQPGIRNTLTIFTQPELAFPPLGNNHFVEGITPINLGFSANVEF